MAKQAMAKPQRFRQLTYQQLRGADYALRIVHTAPAIRGEALKVVEMLIKECRAEMKRQLRARGWFGTDERARKTKAT